MTQGSRLVAARLIITLANFSASSGSYPNSLAADAYIGSYKPHHSFYSLRVSDGNNPATRSLAMKKYLG
jgi:hypothetical protein